MKHSIILKKELLDYIPYFASYVVRIKEKIILPKRKKTPLQTSFGNLIRAKRLQLGISQEELADRSDLHFSYVSSIERGERNITLAIVNKIAKGLNCSMKDLMPVDF